MNVLQPARLALVAAVFLPIAVSAAETIDEIVVTADFRERSGSELPASITVLDAAAVEAVATQHFEEIVDVVPNLNWSGDGHRARYLQIRGVGELEQYEGAPNPSVGFLVDDIDFSGIGTIATLFDIDRVEVLRGPQGTRYGANALGGLVYLRSTAPSPDWSGRAEVMAGGDELLAGGVAAGGALTSDDRWQFRASAHRYRSDGFRENPYLGSSETNGRDETTLRGRLRWLPTDTLSVDLAMLHADVDNGYDAFAIDNSYTTLSDDPGRDAQQSRGASLKIVWDAFEAATLTSITSAADSDIVFSFDADWGNAESWAPVTYDYFSHSERDRRTLSQELRLASAPAGALFGGTTDWLAGLYVLDLQESLLTANRGEYYDPVIDFSDTLDESLSSRYDATNVALFGQLEHDIGDATRLIVGLRAERRTSDYADSDGLQMRPTDTMWGGELSLVHDHSDSLASYVSLSRGYKASGFNLGLVPQGRRSFDDESMWILEAGIKSTWLSDSLALNASVFGGRRDEPHVRPSYQLDPGDPASFVFVTVNAGGADMLGLEAEMRWFATDTVELFANAGLLDTSFDEFVTPQLDLSGRALAHAPSYTFAAGGSYRHSSGFFARLYATARDEFYFDVSHNQRSESYELVDARLGFETENWTLTLWGRNLLDREYAVRGFYFGNEPPDFPNTLYVRLGDPRQIGLTCEMRF